MPRTAPKPTQPTETPTVEVRSLAGFDALSKADQQAVDHIFSRHFNAIDHPDIPRVHGADDTREAAILSAADAVPQAVLAWNNLLRTDIDTPQPDNLTPRGQTITIQQEHALFLAFNLCRYRVIDLRESLTNLRDADTLTSMLAWYRRAMDYRERLIGWFARLIAHFMHAGFGGGRSIKRKCPGMTDTDIVMEAAMCLILAVDRFDWTRGARFQTYAFGRMTGRFDALYKSFGANLIRRTETGAGADLRQMSGDRPRLYAEPHHDHDRDILIDALKRIIEKNLAHLTDEEHKALRCYFAKGTNHQGMATVLRQPVDAIIGLVTSAMTKLRLALERVVWRHHPTPDQIAHIRQTVERVARGDVPLSRAGAAIMARAKAIGISCPRELAERIGFRWTSKFIAHLRRGSQVRFRCDTWAKLAELFGVDADELREATLA